MNDPNTAGPDINEQTESARGTVAATNKAAGETIPEIHQRLKSGIDRCRDMAGKFRDHAVKTDKAVREHPYRTLAIGLGIGALAGYLAARCCARKRD